MNPKELASYNPEMERCRRVREKISLKHKTIEEMFAQIGEISAAKRKEERLLRAKKSAAKIPAKGKLSA